MTEGKGKNGCNQTEDNDIRNEKLENMEKDDKKSEKEKKLADHINDIALQETLRS